MSELPLSKGELTPKLTEGDSLNQSSDLATAIYIDEEAMQGYDRPLSNNGSQVYNNPPANNGSQNFSIKNDCQYSAESQDPQVQRFKGSFWKTAGQVQQAVGSWTQMDRWRESGQQTQAEADSVIQEAESRISNGQASWIHGEYERWMGRFTYAVGHIVGDPEMQAKASLRSREGEDEVNRVIK
ncbi:hypothetical protein BY458DRAFT_590883 [Sporodiniella umbellata]|nr:hypothetical protein BY458DRAFT_590883 [Sporodiniella umbellata]